MADGLVWVLRAFGALYLLGGLFLMRQSWFWARITPSMDRLTRTIEQFNAEIGGDVPAPKEDVARPWWIFSGAVLTALAGAAMLIGHRVAVALLAAIVVHQMLYFIRQRRRELKAASPEEAAEERPTRQTINGFVSATMMALLAAWLLGQGVLM